METSLGKLKISSANLRLDLLALPVQHALATIPDIKDVGVSEIDPELSDTTAFCEHYDVGMNEAANCVVLEAKRSDQTWLAVCVILGSTHADINGLARRTLGARKVSFAPLELAVEKTGMEYGAITPIGLPKDWPVLVDKAVTETDRVIIGSGLRKSKLIIPGHLLATLPNSRVLEGLGRPK